jgi:membrane-bound lytic murein transglycosylase D
MRDEEEERLANRRKHQVIAAKQAYFAPVSTSLHKVHRGETLSEIARSSGTTVDNLRQINKLSRNSVNSGSYLKVPSLSHASVIKEITKSSKSKVSGGQVYIVKKGDTFYNVSKRFAVSQSSLAAMNNISPNSNLRSGQKLVIKSGGQLVASASTSRLIHYKVKKGDSLMQLSRKFGVSLSDLRKSNPNAGKGLIPGQSIKIVTDNQPST